MRKYIIYGLIVNSEIEIPLADEIENDRIDVTVSLSNVPVAPLEDNGDEEQYQFAPQDMWFYFKDEIQYRILNGNKILIWRENPNFSDDMLLTYLCGNAFAFLLMQRYMVPVHGSALAGDNGAIIISGRSGGGKSTIAKALLDKGYQFVTDDIAAVLPKAHQDVIYPGPPWQKICPNEWENLENKDEYTYLIEDSGKYARRLQSGYITEPRQLKAIFILLAEECDNISFREIQGIDKLHHLTHNLFRGSIYHVLGIDPKRMQLFLDVASNTRIFYITRPIGINTVDEIANLIDTQYKTL